MTNMLCNPHVDLKKETMYELPSDMLHAQQPADKKEHGSVVWHNELGRRVWLN